MMFTVVYLESIGENRGRLGSQRASAEKSQSVSSGDAPQMLPASAEKSSSSEMLLSWVLHNKCVARDVRKLTVTRGKSARTDISASPGQVRSRLRDHLGAAFSECAVPQHAAPARC